MPETGFDRPSALGNWPDSLLAQRANWECRTWALPRTRQRTEYGKEPALHHVKARRALDRMKKEKLVEERRGAWYATGKAQKDLNAADHSTNSFQPPTSGFEQS
jgi:hypothetical protein